MEIPEYKGSPAIDFCPFMELLDEKYGWDHRDMAGAFSKEAYAENEAHKRAWMEKNGYGDKWHVLDKPKGYREDWPKDSEEMKLRIEINTKYGDIEKLLERPYQDVWHWLLDHDFCELCRGGYNTIYLHEERFEKEDIPDYVVKVLRAMYEEVKDHPAYDGKLVTFYIDW